MRCVSSIVHGLQVTKEPRGEFAARFRQLTGLLVEATSDLNTEDEPAAALLPVAREVLAGLKSLQRALESHHRGEDRRLFPILAILDDGHLQVIARLAADHQDLDQCLHEANSAVQLWIKSLLAGFTDQGLTMAATGWMGALRDTLADHLRREEHIAVPVLTDSDAYMRGRAAWEAAGRPHITALAALPAKVSTEERDEDMTLADDDDGEMTAAAGEAEDSDEDNDDDDDGHEEDHELTERRAVKRASQALQSIAKRTRTGGAGLA